MNQSLMFDSDGIKYVRRPVGLRNDVNYQVPTVKHGGGSNLLSSRHYGPKHV